MRSSRSQGGRLLLRNVTSNLLVAATLLVPAATQPADVTSGSSESCPELSLETTFLCVTLRFTFQTASKHEYVIVDWGDGTSDASDCVGGGHPCSGSAPHTYAGAGNYTIKVTALTGCPGSVATIPATVSASPEFPLYTGAVDGMLIRPFTPEPLELEKLLSSTIDWGDGSAAEAFEWADDGSGVLYTPSHEYDSSGTYTVVARVQYLGAWGDSCYERVATVEAVVGNATGVEKGTWGALKALYR